MNLIIDVFIDELEPFIKKTVVNNNRIKYKNVELWDQTSSLNDSTLYITMPFFLSSPQVGYENLSIVCMDEEDINNFQTNANIILMKENLSYARICNLVQGVFNKYNYWELQLTDALAEEKGIKTLMEICVPYLGNPLIYFDSYYRALFIVEVPGGTTLEDCYSGQFIEGRLLGDEMMHELNSNDSFTETIYKKGVQVWEHNPWNTQECYYNFYKNGIGDASLLTANCNKPFTPKDYFIMSILGNTIEKVRIQRKIYQKDHDSGLNSLLTDLFSGKYISESAFKQSIIPYHWELMHTYVCISILPNQNLADNLLLSYACNKLEQLYHFSYAFEYQNRLIFIVNLTLINKDRSTFLEDFTCIVKEELLKVGISYDFFGFSQIRDYYRQATAALEIGLKYSYESWAYPFENYGLKYLLDHSKESSSDIWVYPKGLLRIKEHDLNNETAYFKLLKTYLENERSPVHCAKILYLHRSTFNYKLEKMKEILDMNLDEPDSRLYIMLSIKLMEID